MACDLSKNHLWGRSREVVAAQAEGADGAAQQALDWAARGRHGPLAGKKRSETKQHNKRGESTHQRLSPLIYLTLERMVGDQVCAAGCET